MRFSVVSRGDSFSQNISQTIVQKLVHLQFTQDDQKPQLVISVGGDGTMLHAIHDFHTIDHVAFVGIHTGTLGFFTDYTCQQVDQFIQDVQKPFKRVAHPLLQARCYFHDKLIRHVSALNEIRIENNVKTLTLQVSLNQQFLEEFRGNGVCVSGQIGSTAYNRSIGGAIIDDNLQVLQLSEVAGIHHQHYRSLKSPLILNPQTTVCLESAQFEGALLLYDHLSQEITGINRIEIGYQKKHVDFARFKPHNYYLRLRSLF